MDMLVIARTQPGQFSSDIGAVGHEACGLEHRAELAPNASDPAGHSKLAHVRLDPQHIIMFQQIGNLVEGPAGREPWVLVQEEATLLTLVFIDLSTEPYISLRLFHSELELLKPLGAVAVHMFVELL